MKKVVGLLLASLINKERSMFNLLPVSYDFKLHDYLKDSVTNNGSWFYESGPNIKKWTIENNERYCDLNGCFLRPQNNSYMMRDTMRDSIVKIFRYRLAQRNCKHTDFVDGKKCSWKYAYYDVLMQKDFKSFACKILNYQGRFVPDNLVNVQKKSWWCFFNTEVFYWQ